MSTPTLSKGDRIRLNNTHPIWTVQAISPHHAILIKPAPFKPKGSINYTILNLDTMIAGPANTLGNEYKLLPDTDTESQHLLQRVEDPDDETMISHRKHQHVTINQHA